MTTLSGLFQAGINQVRKSWGWFLALGILLFVLGAVCIVKAETATTFSILALGWILAISAVLWFVSSFHARSGSTVFLHLLNAILRSVTAYLLIRHPDAGAAALTMLLAALFIVGGIFRGAAAIAIQFPKWGWTVFAGLVSVLLGTTLLITWPGISTYFVGLAIGIDLALDGAALVGFATALQSLPKLYQSETKAA